MAYSCVRVCFEIGHEASVRNKRTPEGFTHDWEVFVRGADNTDISQFVDRVIFQLHDTFPKPKRVIKEPPYSVKESGYAGFLLPVEVHFKNRDEPKKVLFNYDLQLQPSGPPLSKVLREKFVFPNPPEDLRRKLIRGGGVGVTGSEGGSFIASPKPSAPDEITSLKPILPLVGKPKLGGDAAKKHKSKDYRPDEPPRAKDSFADLFGPPIHKTKVSPDAKKSSSSSSKLTEKSGEKQSSGGKSSKHIPQKEVKETTGSMKEDTKERVKDREKSKDKSSKRSSTPPKNKQSSPKRPPSPKRSSPKRSSSPKRPTSPPKHSSAPSSSRSPPHKRPITPKLKFEENKKKHDDSKGRSESKATESGKSEKKKKEKKSREEKSSSSKEKSKEDNKMCVEKTEKSEKSKEFKEKEKKVPKETLSKESDKIKEKNFSVPRDKEKQKHKHKKKDKNKHEESGKEKNRDKEKPSKKNSEKSHDVKEREKNGINREIEEKRKVRSPSVSPVRPSSSPAKPQLKERTSKHPLKLLWAELSDPESSDSNTSLLSEDESESSKKLPKSKDAYNQSSTAKAIQSIEDVVNNVSCSSTSNKAQITKPKPNVPESIIVTKINGKQKERSGSKKNREKKEGGNKSSTKEEGKGDKGSKKRKRKNSAKGKDDTDRASPTGDPSEKILKSDIESFKMEAPPPPLVVLSEPSPVRVEQTPVQKEVDVSSLDPSTAEYVLQLKELQRKIMTLEDNAELQRVVQVIAETGQYEITKKTFDFDLCALDRTTVKRLQDFFAVS